LDLPLPIVFDNSSLKRNISTLLFSFLLLHSFLSVLWPLPQSPLLQGTPRSLHWFPSVSPFIRAPALGHVPVLNLIPLYCPFFPFLPLLRTHRADGVLGPLFEFPSSRPHSFFLGFQCSQGSYDKLCWNHYAPPSFSNRHTSSLPSLLHILPYRCSG